MARFSRKTVLLFLLVLILVSMALRYPLVEHERQQTDSYFIHMLSSSIVSNGYAAWVFHPLSLFGYYPFSYPSGIPFLLAELSSVTGLGMEATVLVFDFALCILFCLTAFALGLQFLKKPEYVLLATFFAVLGSRFVDTTYWDASARGPVVVMIVLVVLVLLRVAVTRQHWLYLVGFIFGLGCFVIHHMAVLLVIFALAHLLAAFQVHYLYRHFMTHKRAFAGAFNVGVLLMVIVVSFMLFSFFKGLTTLDLGEESLFNFEPRIVASLVNMAASYTNQIGPILPVAIIGIPALFSRFRVSTQTLFPVTLLIAFVPLLESSLYVSMVIAPFVAILGVAWLAKMHQSVRRTRLFSVMLVTLMVSSMILPILSIQRWNDEVHLAGDRVEVDCQLFNDASYLTWLGGDPHAISNVAALSLQMSAISEVDFLGSGLFLPLSGDITQTDIGDNTIWSTARFPVNLYKWFEYENAPRVDVYIRGLIVYGLDYLYSSRASHEASEYFLAHEKMVIVIDGARPSEYVDSYSIFRSEFILELWDASWPAESEGASISPVNLESYCYYQSEGASMFLFCFPD